MRHTELHRALIAFEVLEINNLNPRMHFKTRVKHGSGMRLLRLGQTGWFTREWKRRSFTQEWKLRDESKKAFDPALEMPARTDYIERIARDGAGSEEILWRQTKALDKWFSARGMKPDFTEEVLRVLDLVEAGKSHDAIAAKFDKSKRWVEEQTKALRAFGFDTRKNPPVRNHPVILKPWMRPSFWVDEPVFFREKISPEIRPSFWDCRRYESGTPLHHDGKLSRLRPYRLVPKIKRIPTAELIPTLDLKIAAEYDQRRMFDVEARSSGRGYTLPKSDTVEAVGSFSPLSGSYFDRAKICLDGIRSSRDTFFRFNSRRLVEVRELKPGEMPKSVQSLFSEFWNCDDGHAWPYGGKLNKKTKTWSLDLDPKRDKDWLEDLIVIRGARCDVGSACAVPYRRLEILFGTYFGDDERFPVIRGEQKRRSHPLGPYPFVTLPDYSMEYCLWVGGRVCTSTWYSVWFAPYDSAVSLCEYSKAAGAGK